MNCSRCGRQLTEDNAYNFQGRPICEDCMMDAGLSPHECDPWATYVDEADRLRHGVKGSAGLTETGTRIYTFVKEKGKATRPEVSTAVGLSETELDEQLTSLMHNELVKEVSDGKSQYLMAIK